MPSRGHPAGGPPGLRRGRGVHVTSRVFIGRSRAEVAAAHGAASGASPQSLRFVRKVEGGGWWLGISSVRSKTLGSVLAFGPFRGRTERERPLRSLGCFCAARRPKPSASCSEDSPHAFGCFIFRSSVITRFVALGCHPGRMPQHTTTKLLLLRLERQVRDERLGIGEDTGRWSVASGKPSTPPAGPRSVGPAASDAARGAREDARPPPEEAASTFGSSTTPPTRPHP